MFKTAVSALALTTAVSVMTPPAQARGLGELGEALIVLGAKLAVGVAKGAIGGLIHRWFTPYPRPTIQRCGRRSPIGKSAPIPQSTILATCSISPMRASTTRCCAWAMSTTPTAT